MHLIDLLIPNTKWDIKLWKVLDVKDMIVFKNYAKLGDIRTFESSISFIIYLLSICLGNATYWWSTKRGHQIIEFLRWHLHSRIRRSLLPQRKRRPSSRLVHFRFVGQRMARYVAVRFSRCLTGQARVIRMVTDIAEQFRVARNIAARGRIQSQITYVIRVVWMFGDVT